MHSLPEVRQRREGVSNAAPNGVLLKCAGGGGGGGAGAEPPRRQAAGGPAVCRQRCAAATSFPALQPPAAAGCRNGPTSTGPAGPSHMSLD